MKKNLVISLTFLLLASLSVQAQHRFGVSPGLSLSSIFITSDLGPDAEKKFKPGFDGGVFAELAVSDKFSIQPEINYSMQGVKLTSDDGDAFLRFNYITIPLLAKVKPVKGLGFFAGPQLGILLSAKQEDTEGNETDIKNQLEKSDVYFVLGADYQFPIGVYAGVRYNIGLEKIVANEGEFLQNRYVSVRVGYSIPIGAKKVKNK